MRRGFSIFLILFFGLGPLAVALPGSEDARLPACCRRHGAHHCAMSSGMMARMLEAASGSTPTVTAPPTCPFFPGYATPATSTLLALALVPGNMPALLARATRTASGRLAASCPIIRSHAGRGPPVSVQS